MGDPIVHFEIHGNDDGQNDFYAAVFGWKIDADNPMNYGMVDTDSGEGIAGGLTKSDTAPPSWSTFRSTTWGRRWPRSRPRAAQW